MLRQSLNGPTLVNLSRAASISALPHPPSIGMLGRAALACIASLLARIQSALQGAPSLYSPRVLSRRAAGERVFHRRPLPLPHPHHGHPASHPAGRFPDGFGALDCPSRHRWCSRPRTPPHYALQDGICGMHPWPAMRPVCYCLQEGAGVRNARLGLHGDGLLREDGAGPHTRTLGPGLMGASACLLERARQGAGGVRVLRVLLLSRVV